MAATWGAMAERAGSPVPGPPGASGREERSARIRRATVPDWRTAAAWWVRRELGSPPDGLIRILDVRMVADREAWISLESGGCHVVVGLRHEPVALADAAAYSTDDGWYRLLYLTVGGGTAPCGRVDPAS